MKIVKILVTGGGTGGHVSPALAVMQEVQRLAIGADWSPEFRYIGSRHGVEQGLVEALGIPFVGVSSGKLRRASTLRGLLTLKNLSDALRVPVGIGQAIGEVRRFKPDVVLATGGYVSVPPVIAAGLLRRPVLIHEQTVQIGLANQIAARFATRIALTFGGAATELPPSLRRKTFVTGNPVRQAIFGGDRVRAIKRFDFDPSDNALPTVYATGGALGATRINQAVEAILPDLLSECRVIHQCGQPDSEHLASVHAALPKNLQRRYRVVPFVGTEIADVFALCDLIVGRSGAGTVTEAAALGKPALFIPLVPTGGDEQTRNARRSVEAGAAVLLPSKDLDGPRLLSELRGLLGDPTRLTAMGQAALALATPKAASDLAAALLALAGK
ncbi:MAG: UDP-N-acetylglucosamine--N-acetylmuramyl-(pentapeptide) pyrophosphoryl-undecaprenol N-acetylglucosamine transferase [Janthinobacterium lividum]